jgi:hypothetical protein
MAGNFIAGMEYFIAPGEGANKEELGYSRIYKKRLNPRKRDKPYIRRKLKSSR